MHILHARAVASRRSLDLGMTSFGMEAYARKASASGISLEAMLQEAVLCYLAERDANRSAWRVPRFTRPWAIPADHRLAVELDLTDGEWRELQREAEVQSVSPERLVHHAALLYLSDLDEGRVGARVMLGADAESGSEL